MMEYSNYLLFLVSPLGHDCFTVGLVAERPPLSREDHGVAFRGLGHPGVTRTLVPLLLLLPAQATSRLGLRAAAAAYGMTTVMK